MIKKFNDYSLNETKDNGKRWNDSNLFADEVNSGSVNTVIYMLKNGEDPNLDIDGDGATPITFIEVFYEKDWKNTTGLIQLLIDKGADVNKTDLDGKTPLFQVFSRSLGDELRNMLLKAGAQLIDADFEELDIKDEMSKDDIEYINKNYPDLLKEYDIKKKINEYNI